MLGTSKANTINIKIICMIPNRGQNAGHNILNNKQFTHNKNGQPIE